MSTQKRWVQRSLTENRLWRKTKNPNCTQILELCQKVSHYTCSPRTKASPFIDLTIVPVSPGWVFISITLFPDPRGQTQSLTWKAEEFKGNRKMWHPSTNFLPFIRDITDNKAAGWLQAFTITLRNRGRTKHSGSLIIQEAVTQTVEKPKHFWHSSSLLHAFSWTLNEGKRKWRGMIFQSVNSATWSAVLVNRSDGQGNRNHPLKMSLRFPVGFNYPYCLCPKFCHW